MILVSHSDLLQRPGLIWRFVTTSAALENRPVDFVPSNIYTYVVLSELDVDIVLHLLFTQINRYAGFLLHWWSFSG